MEHLRIKLVERWMDMIDKSEYVVLDVETNGLSSMRDDLLSISLYRPDTEDFYSRFLPLELQKDVYTTYINGIKKYDLKDKKFLLLLKFQNCKQVPTLLHHVHDNNQRIPYLPN